MDVLQVLMWRSKCTCETLGSSKDEDLYISLASGLSKCLDLEMFSSRSDLHCSSWLADSECVFSTRESESDSRAALLPCPSERSTQRLFDMGNWVWTLARGSQEPGGTRRFLCVSGLERKSRVCALWEQAAKSSPDHWTNIWIFGWIPNSIFNLPPTSRPTEDPKHWARPIQRWSMRLSAQSGRASAQALRLRSTPPDVCVLSTDVPAYDKLCYACVDPQRRLIRCQISLRRWRFGM